MASVAAGCETQASRGDASETGNGGAKDGEGTGYADDEERSTISTRWEREVDETGEMQWLYAVKL